MNRNVSIVVAILVLVVIAGYLIWLRSKVQPVIPAAQEQVQVTPIPTPTMTASPSASPSGKEATGAAKQKTSTPSSIRR